MYREFQGKRQEQWRITTENILDESYLSQSIRTIVEDVHSQ